MNSRTPIAKAGRFRALRGRVPSHARDAARTLRETGRFEALDASCGYADLQRRFASS